MTASSVASTGNDELQLTADADLDGAALECLASLAESLFLSLTDPWVELAASAGFRLSDEKPGRRPRVTGREGPAQITIESRSGGPQGIETVIAVRLPQPILPGLEIRARRPETDDPSPGLGNPIIDRSLCILSKAPQEHHRGSRSADSCGSLTDGRQAHRRSSPSAASAGERSG